MDMPLDTSLAISSFKQLQAQDRAKIQAQKDDIALREQTDAFEALILKIVLESAIKNDDILYPKQPGSDIYHAMYIDQLSQSLSGSFGYSELLFNFLKEQQNLHTKSAQKHNKHIKNLYNSTYE